MRTLADICLAENDRKAIAAAVGVLRGSFPVERVVLFGSKARGGDDPESDIDLLVLTARKLDWREERAITTALFAVEMDYDVVISTLIVPVQEWSSGVYPVLPIHDEIMREGAAA
jgi:uncharacterized protein